MSAHRLLAFETPSVPDEVREASLKRAEELMPIHNAAVLSAEAVFGDCAAGNADRCDEIFERSLYVTNTVSPQRRERWSIILLNAALENCEAGDAEWCGRFGGLVPVFNVLSPQGNQRIWRVYDLCEGKHAEVCFFLSFVFSPSFGLEKPDYESRARLDSCSHGYVPACRAAIDNLYFKYIRSQETSDLDPVSEVLVIACDDLADDYACEFRNYLTRN